MPKIKFSTPGIIKDVSHILTFGKYKGASIAQVLEDAPSYILWAHRIGAVKVSDQIYQTATSLDDADEDGYDLDSYDYFRRND